MKRGNWVGVGLVGLSLGGCAASPSSRQDRRDRPDDELAAFAEAAQIALDSRDVELPTRARRLADIRLITRAYDIARACVPGRGRFSVGWAEDNADRLVHTAQGRRTVRELSGALLLLK